jgi:hypothetical protein
MVMAKLSACLIEHHDLKRYGVGGTNPLVQQIEALYD